MMNNYHESDMEIAQFDMGEPTLRVRRLPPLEVSFPVATPIPQLEPRSEEQSSSTLSSPEDKQEEQTSVSPSNLEQVVPVASSVPRLPPSSVTFKRLLQKGQKQRRIVAIGAVLGLIALLSVSLFFGWRFVKSSPTAVTVYQVGVQNVYQSIGGGGITFPRQQLDISFPVDERVLSVLVKPGDQVYPKQALLQLDPSKLDAQVELASNNVAAAQAYLNSVSASGNSVQIAQAQQAYDLAKNRYDALVAQASSPTLRNGTLISPMRGVVTSVNINSGEIFTANTVLLTIMDESTVIVRAKVPLANLGQVHHGQAALVTPSALPTLNLSGTVSAIVPQADPQTDTFEVWVEVPNPNGTLLPGMGAYIRIQSPMRALAIPRLAVLNTDRESIVFVVHNQHAYIQRVHIVGRSIDTIFIDSGLSKGDKVVVVGLDKLQDGQIVRVTRTENQTS